MVEDKIDEIRNIICSLPNQVWKSDYTTIYRGKKISLASRDDAKQMLFVVDGIKIEDKDNKILKYFGLLDPYIQQKKEEERISRICYIHSIFKQNEF